MKITLADFHPCLADFFCSVNGVFYLKTSHHIRTGNLLLGIMRRIRRLSYLSSSLFPSGKLPVRMCWQVLKAGINYQIQEFSLQLKNGWLEVLELVALLLFKTRTCDAKNSWQFFVDAIFCFVKTCFQKRKKYNISLMNRSSLTLPRT